MDDKTTTCQHCGTTFRVDRPSRAKTRRYCSHKCSWASRGRVASISRDLSGLRVNRLTVLSPAPRRKGASQSKTRWLCVCECGTEVEVDTADLTRTDGRARVSCGCRNFRPGTESPHWKSPNEIPLKYWHGVRGGAKARGLDFDLTIEDAYALFLAQDRRCRFTGRVIGFGSGASLDRIDYREGYHLGNVQWVHVDVNMAKRRLSDEKFVELCKEVASYDRSD